MNKITKLLDDSKKLLDKLEAVEAVGASVEVKTYENHSGLSDASKAMMKNIEKTISYAKDGKVYKSLFLACSVAEDNINAGLDAISANVNQLVEKGYANSFLAPLSTLALMNVPMLKPRVVAFAFLHVLEESYEEAKAASEHFVNEGDIGKNVGDVEYVPQTGEFHWALQVTHMMSMTGKSNQELVDKEISEALKYLPKDTEVVSVTQFPVSSLSVPYLVTFRNPLMQNIKSVEFEYERNAAMVDGHLKQFNLLTAIKYQRR